MSTMPAYGSLEYYEQELNNKKFIRDAIRQKIKDTMSDPNFVPTADELYRLTAMLDHAETQYNIADKNFEAINNELNEQIIDKEKRRNADY